MSETCYCNKMKNEPHVMGSPGCAYEDREIQKGIDAGYQQHINEMRAGPRKRPTERRNPEMLDRRKGGYGVPGFLNRRRGRGRRQDDLTR